MSLNVRLQKGYNIAAFVLKYARGGLKEELASKRDSLKVKYLDYDWSLNGT